MECEQKWRNSGVSKKFEDKHENENKQLAHMLMIFVSKINEKSINVSK